MELDTSQTRKCNSSNWIHYSDWQEANCYHSPCIWVYTDRRLIIEFNEDCQYVNLIDCGFVNSCKYDNVHRNLGLMVDQSRTKILNNISYFLTNMCL